MSSSKDISRTHHEQVSPPRRSSVTEVAPLPDDKLGISDDAMRGMSVALPNLKEVIDGAKTATNTEHDMGVIEAVRSYPKAVIFALGISFSLIMEGYDTALLGNFFAFQPFNHRYGQRVGNTDTYQLTPSWQAGLQNGAQIGQICGLMVAGLIADRVGYKKTLLGAQPMMIAVIFLFFFAKNVGMLFAAEVLAGLPWGAFQTLTTTYAADVTPVALRPILTTYSNMCWVIGQLISTGVIRAFIHRTDEWAYRVPFAIQWAWPIPIMICIFLAPESPNWLVRAGRIPEARKALRTLTSKRFTEEMIDQKIEMIIHTNELERQADAGTSYLDCFRGTNLRRTEIACVTWMAQVGCGVWFGGNITYFLELAGGLDAVQAFDFGLGTNALGLVATTCAWALCQRVGRRTLYLTGLSVMFTVLLIVGFLGIPKLSPAIGYTSGALMMCFVLAYDLTVGPICYSLVAEIPSTRLRIKTVVLARNSYNIASICANFLNAPILNPLGWNLRGKGGFVWCGFCLICLVWTYFRLPEPMGLTSAEMDVLFERKVSARNFRKVHVDPFRSDHLKPVRDDDVQLEVVVDEKAMR